MISTKQYVEAARRLYHEEGEIEIDESERGISRGDDGVWVRAWVWVDNTDAKAQA